MPHLHKRLRNGNWFPILVATFVSVGLSACSIQAVCVFPGDETVQDTRALEGEIVERTRYLARIKELHERNAMSAREVERAEYLVAESRLRLALATGKPTEVAKQLSLIVQFHKRTRDRYRKLHETGAISSAKLAEAEKSLAESQDQLARLGTPADPSGESSRSSSMTTAAPRGRSTGTSQENRPSGTIRNATDSLLPQGLSPAGIISREEANQTDESEPAWIAAVQARAASGSTEENSALSAAALQLLKNPPTSASAFRRQLSRSVKEELQTYVLRQFEPSFKATLGNQVKVSCDVKPMYEGDRRAILSGDAVVKGAVFVISAGDLREGFLQVSLSIGAPYGDPFQHWTKPLGVNSSRNLKPLGFGSPGYRSKYESSKLWCGWMADGGHVAVMAKAGDPGFRKRPLDMVAVGGQFHNQLVTNELYSLRTKLLSLTSEPAVQLVMLDTNPAYSNGVKLPLFMPENMAALTSEQLQRVLQWREQALEEASGESERTLLQLTKVRHGVVSDGNSRMVLRIRLPEAGRVRITLPGGPNDGILDDPFGTHELAIAAGEGRNVSAAEADALAIPSDDGFCAHVLYRPPHTFHAANPELHTSFREIPVHVTRPDGTRIAALSLLLIRTPVLLVHGTFDNPQCWKLKAPPAESCQQFPGAEIPQRGTLSMTDYLRERGFHVHFADFSKSNGQWSTSRESWLTGGDDGTSMLANARVVWDRENAGIQSILDDYHKEGVAVTQVDVVGHSFGGLLARIWAAETEFFAPAHKDLAYRRPDNFQQGDIHRLLTIGTPHHGSDCAQLLKYLVRAPKERIPTLARKPIVQLWMSWSKDRALTNLVRDQIPESEALKGIGATAVPSHAIVCLATARNLREFKCEYLTNLNAIFKELFQSRPEVLQSFLEARGQGAATDRLLAEIRSQGWFTGSNETPIQDPGVLLNLFRVAVFANTWSDMTVREESQIGGLPMPYVSIIHDVLHGYAPRYETVQERVAELLNGPHDRFCKDGFPRAGKKLYDATPPHHTQDPNARKVAVVASGYVDSHAEAFSYVAQMRDELILARPVNHHATGLLEADHSTKDMLVKGKSSNWGPQKGRIPCEQRFSKLYFETEDRDSKIKDFDAEVAKCLKAKRAISVQLQESINGVLYDVLVRKDRDDALAAIVLQYTNEDGDASFHEWQTQREIPAGELDGVRLYPMTVLGDRFTGRPLTADYDLLAIGPRAPPNVELPFAEATTFDPEMGYINERQKQLISDLNVAVRIRTHYSGGNVAHHGPETQYTGSPGVDYPITVFHPTGYILSIDQGPEGQEDVELKRYFHQQIRLGYNLYPNPVWGWRQYDPERYPETGWDPTAQKRKPDALKTRPANDPYDSDEGAERVPKLLAP